MRKKIRQIICSKAVLYIILAVLVLSGRALSAEKDELQFSRQPEIQQVRPKKPVKIKVHRNAKGEYSWEFSGDNIDDIVSADKRLRKALKSE